MSFVTHFTKTIPVDKANKIANEALITITSESKKQDVELDQLSTLSLITFILSIQPNLDRIIREKSRREVVTYLTTQIASLNVAKETLLNIVNNITEEDQIKE